MKELNENTHLYKICLFVTRHDLVHVEIIKQVSYTINIFQFNKEFFHKLKFDTSQSEVKRILSNVYIRRLTLINSFTAGLSSRPFRNTKSVSFAVLSNSDIFSLTCWNAAVIKINEENMKREKLCNEIWDRRGKMWAWKFLWSKIWPLLKEHQMRNEETISAASLKRKDVNREKIYENLHSISSSYSRWFIFTESLCVIRPWRCSWSERELFMCMELEVDSFMIPVMFSYREKIRISSSQLNLGH